MEYEPVIGLEVHSQLLTKSKLFCSCSTNFGGAPNTNVCPVCLGLPGSLPVLNREAVTMAVQAGLALNCTIHEKSIFARKNYFYPDLPKGYQISQFEEPIATKGYLDIEVDGVVKRVGITRAHMEEDAGKNLHGVAGDSLVDLNRAGTPLVEIVGDPDLRSSAEAAAYMRALRDILVFIGVNDGNLEEGSFRCDANVSIRPKGTEAFGTRCELKNINSFKFVQRAIDAEIVRQTAILDAGGKIRQETRSFDPDTGLTHTLRSKEEAHDYRYFPEPDLPPLRVEAAFVATARERLNELPQAVRKRWVADFGLTPAAALTLTQHPKYASFFEAVLKQFNQPVKVANFVANDVLRGAKSHGLDATFTVNPTQVADLLALVDSGEISGKQAKDVFAAIEGSERLPRSVVDERGLRVVSDSGALEALCRQLIDKYPSQAASMRAGKKGLMGFFVGQAMKETGGSANPKLVNDLLEKLLGGPS
ncbi:MAG TPA: Asp-tRNA(Asn)/Glu-tRNA(Gln) amidotransferase subunit GatB [Polyangiaceae bacterium]|jgi:aspartyl-tRNA(Asn)/glutamyl-tRNA(Gln) amidotransferase subunit B|nr:Asp-tRNA(Asn)/Glu-tRNA(Gln) amidotransferase subunit GatB [Polyangiaceae bacterium]